jgi:hypothetical protein
MRTYRTITYGGTQKTFAAWGISRPRREVNNQSSESFGFDISALCDSNEVFPYGAEIIVRYGVQLDNSGEIIPNTGTVEFVGYRTEELRNGSPEIEQLAYKFAGIWEYFFERLPFEQLAPSWDPVTHTSVMVPRSQVVLGQGPDGTRQTVAAQIAEIVNYIIAQMTEEFGAAKVQLGAGLPAEFVAFDQVNSLTCSEALRKMLRWIGSSSVWFDYSTTPPTLQCKSRPNLTPVTCPIVGSGGIKIMRRDDLIPPVVHLMYRVSVHDTLGDYERILHDVAGVNGYVDSEGALHGASTIDALLAGKKFGVIAQTYDFVGPSFARQKVTFETSALPIGASNAAVLDWWCARCPELNQVTNLSIASNATFSPSLPSNAVYMITKGSWADWLDGVGLEVTCEQQFSGEVYTPDNRLAHVWQRVSKQTKFTATSLPGGTYYSAPQITQGEVIPFGLAKSIYDVEKIPQYEGNFVIHEDEITNVVGVGNALNLTGGKAEWESMNAQVQQVSYDYESGITTVTFGPARHLGAGDLIERLRANRSIRTILYSSSSRTNAEMGSASSAPDYGSRENSTTGPATPALLAGFESDNTVSQPDALGRWWLDASARSLGISGKDFVDETHPGDGVVEVKLAEIDTPIAPTGDPLTNAQQRKHDIRLREVEISIPGGNSKKYFTTLPCSAPYSKTADDGELGGGIELFKIDDVHEDYLLCRKWDGVSQAVSLTGELIPVAIGFKNRYWNKRADYASDVIDGVTMAYSDPPTGYDKISNRHVIGTYVEENVTKNINIQQMLYIPWRGADGYYAGDPIYAMRCNHTGVFVAEIEAKYIYVETNRPWALRESTI